MLQSGLCRTGVVFLDYSRDVKIHRGSRYEVQGSGHKVSGGGGWGQVE